MKINISQLGLKKKTVDIKNTVKVVNQATKLQILMLKMDKVQLDANSDPLEVMEKSQDATDAMTEFIQRVLKLSDSDMDKVADNVTMEELSNFVGYVLARIQGLSDEQWQDTLKENEEEEDPKK